MATVGFLRARMGNNRPGSVKIERYYFEQSFIHGFYFFHIDFRLDRMSKLLHLTRTQFLQTVADSATSIIHPRPLEAKNGGKQTMTATRPAVLYLQGDVCYHDVLVERARSSAISSVLDPRPSTIHPHHHDATEELRPHRSQQQGTAVPL